MTCPWCGGNTKVINSRPQEDIVYRRRECLICKERFSTTEIDVDMCKEQKALWKFIKKMQKTRRR